MGKCCKTCGVTKAISCFSSNGKSGHHPHCKTCRAAAAKRARDENPDAARAAERRRYADNRDGKVKSIKRYYEANREAILARNAARYERKAEVLKAASKEYRRTNPEKVRAWNGARRAIERKACPPWADKAAIAAIYAEAVRLERETGIPHHVDHIVPLRGKTICGLHVAENLRAIPAIENLKKGSRFVGA